MGMEEAAGTQTRTLRFQRRAMLKMMMALPIAGIMPLSSLAEMVARTAPDSFVSADGTAWKLHVLTPHEWTTVGVLSDWILPPMKFRAAPRMRACPSSSTTGWIFNVAICWLRFARGWRWLDTECQRNFRQNFVDCSATQQQQMLDRIAWPEKAAAQDAKAVAFFNRFRDLTLSGFYTSEMGTRDYRTLAMNPRRSGEDVHRTCSQSWGSKCRCGHFHYVQLIGTIRCPRSPDKSDPR